MTTRRALSPLLGAAVVVAALVTGRYVWYSRGFDRHIQIARSGQMYVDAIFAFHAKTGRYPSSLHELVPTFLSDSSTNDVVKGWDYKTGPDGSGRSFLLSKHGVLPHTYVQYQSSGIIENIASAPPVGWVENLEGRVTMLSIEPGSAANAGRLIRSESNRMSGAAGSSR